MQIFLLLLFHFISFHSISFNFTDTISFISIYLSIYFILFCCCCCCCCCFAQLKHKLARFAKSYQTATGKSYLGQWILFKSNHNQTPSIKHCLETKAVALSQLNLLNSIWSQTVRHSCQCLLISLKLSLIKLTVNICLYRFFVTCHASVGSVKNTLIL